MNKDGCRTWKKDGVDRYHGWLSEIIDIERKVNQNRPSFQTVKTFDG